MNAVRITESIPKCRPASRVGRDNLRGGRAGALAGVRSGGVREDDAGDAVFSQWRGLVRRTRRFYEFRGERTGTGREFRLDGRRPAVFTAEKDKLEKLIAREEARLRISEESRGRFTSLRKAV